MSLVKRFKKDNINRDNDDDIVIIGATTTSAATVNNLCQHIDKVTRESCREYYSVLCIHCNLYLCYMHVEIHRILLTDERDQLINELNERIDELNQLIENPDKMQNMLIEQLQIKHKMKISFIQRLCIEKSVNLKTIIVELKQLFQPVRKIFELCQCVSLIQIKKIQECVTKFDENKKLIFKKIIDAIPIEQKTSVRLFQLSNIDSPSRQYELPVQRSSSNEMAASEDLLIINDREHILLFNLTTSIDDTLIPELIEWKQNLDGKILDIHYSVHLKLFFILTDEKLLSYNRSASLNCLHRFTSLPWSCTTLLNSIFILYKYSKVIERWTFEQTSSSIQILQQWNLSEIVADGEHDQHLRCIRTSPDQTLLAILIEDDECRWRIALFDHNMNRLHQTDMLVNASTIDWNLIFSFISDRQLITMDATNENIYLTTIDENTSFIEYKQISNTDYPVNACTITNNGYRQLILKMVKPNKLKFFEL